MIFAKGIEIGYAYTSFKWENNAKRNAGVTVVVISLRAERPGQKVIFTDSLQIEATNINGYYFMSLYDIIDYKTAMGREKEQEIVNLIKKYQESGINNRKGFLRTMAKVIGIDKTKEFLGKVAN